MESGFGGIYFCRVCSGATLAPERIMWLREALTSSSLAEFQPQEVASQEMQMRRVLQLKDLPVEER